MNTPEKMAKELIHTLLLSADGVEMDGVLLHLDMSALVQARANVAKAETAVESAISFGEIVMLARRAGCAAEEQSVLATEALMQAANRLADEVVWLRREIERARARVDLRNSEFLCAKKAGVRDFLPQVGRA